MLVDFFPRIILCSAIFDFHFRENPRFRVKFQALKSVKTCKPPQKEHSYLPLFCMLSRRRHRTTVTTAMTTTKAMPATQAMMMMIIFIGRPPASSDCDLFPSGAVIMIKNQTLQTSSNPKCVRTKQSVHNDCKVELHLFILTI